MVEMKSMTVLTVWLVLMACTAMRASQAAPNPTTHPTAFMHPKEDPEARVKHLVTPGGFGLVAEPTVILDYHFGPVMSGKGDQIKLFVVYYGTFSKKQRATLNTFFKSFWAGTSRDKRATVGKWWKITRNYVDLYNSPVAKSIVLAGEMSDRYSLGKDITQNDIQSLVIKSMKKFGADARSLYLVLTSDDVLVERFCMSVCGTHFYTFPSDATKSQMVPYGWVGNPSKQCPEFCSWPYAAGGFQTKALIAPNGDAGIDGMIITIANLLAGMGTNPYGNAFFQADGLEASGVCQGIYGKGAFPGYPGELQVDNSTGASYNVVGAKNMKFLVPWMWDPTTLQCTGQA